MNIPNLSGIHESASKAAGLDGRNLSCENCGAKIKVGKGDGAKFLSIGWPKCCGYTMMLGDKPA